VALDAEVEVGHDQKDPSRHLERIPNAREIVLPRTGHMFRFSHPVTYAEAVEKFLRKRVDVDETADRLTATG